MNLSLSTLQASELADLLDNSLREMSHEIAATDNGRYRAQLLSHRQVLAEIRMALGPTGRPGVADAEAVERELSHPGG